MNQLDIQEYLKSIGIRRSIDFRKFTKQLSSKHGVSGRKCIEEFDARARGEETSDVYDLKNESLDLAIDVASQFASDQFKQYLQWFIGNKVSCTGVLLDLCCDIGVLTCFYAKMFPDATVIGVDRSKNSINCAKQLAAKLGLSNIIFEQIDVVLQFSELSKFKANTICSTMWVYELDGQEAGVAYLNELATGINTLLEPNGNAIFMEPNNKFLEIVQSVFNVNSKGHVSFTNATGHRFDLPVLFTSKQ